jgi:hypothetical protein
MKRTKAICIVLTALMFASGCTHRPVATPHDSPSSDHAPWGPMLVGRGPFVAFNLNVGNDTYEAFAIDLSSKKRFELSAGWYGAGQGSEYALSEPQIWGEAVPILKQTKTGSLLALLRRAPAPSFVVQGRILHFSASPDGLSVIALVKEHETDSTLRLLRYSTNGSQLIEEPKDSIPWADGDYSIAPTVWLSDSSWLARGLCACDYGSATQGWYRLSSSGVLRPDNGFGFPGPSLSASHDGRSVVWLDAPVKPCGPYDDTCPDGAMRIVIGDTLTRSIRRIGTFVNDKGVYTSVVISPDGTRLAIADRKSIRLLSPADAAVLASATYKLANLRVLALLNDETVLAQGDDASSTHNKTTVLLVHFRMNGRAQVEPIVSGDLYFSGWLR